MSLRDLNLISIERGISKTSKKHLKRDDFFVTSLRPIKEIPKKMSFVRRLCDVSCICQKRCLFRDISETSQKHLSQVFMILQKYPTIMVLCDFHRVTETFDKIRVEPLEILNKWNVFWDEEQCITINQDCYVYQWSDICLGVLRSQRLSKLDSKWLFTTIYLLLLVFFFSTEKTLCKPLSLPEIIVTRNRYSVSTGRTGRSTHLCWEWSYTRTHSSSPGIKI